MTRLNPICVCTMNMCHKPVHDLVRICTSNHAHHISSSYAHDPHHAHLVEIGVSVNYKDSYYLYIL